MMVFDHFGIWAEQTVAAWLCISRESNAGRNRALSCVRSRISFGFGSRSRAAGSVSRHASARNLRLVGLALRRFDLRHSRWHPVGARDLTAAFMFQDERKRPREIAVHGVLHCGSQRRPRDAGNAFWTSSLCQSGHCVTGR